VIRWRQPTADAILQLIIESVGNLPRYSVGGFDSLGDIAEDVIMPFLVARCWPGMSGRTPPAENLGWVHLFEIYKSVARTNAWSLAALEVLTRWLHREEGKERE